MTIAPEREDTIEELDFPTPPQFPRCFKTGVLADVCGCQGCMMVRELRRHVRVVPGQVFHYPCVCSPTRRMVLVAD